MVHQRQGLALGLEPGDDLARVHPRLDDLEGDLAADGLRLLGHVDDAHARLRRSAASSLYGPMTDPGLRAATLVTGDRREDGVFQEVAGVEEGPEQTLDFAAQHRIVAACLRQVAGSFGGRLELERPSEDPLQVRLGLGHALVPREGVRRRRSPRAYPPMALTFLSVADATHWPVQVGVGRIMDRHSDRNARCN